MWKNTPISPSNCVIFKDFDSIYAIAKAMKGCHYFYLSAEDHRLYGTHESLFSLHAVDVPRYLEIPASLTFKFSSIIPDMVSKYKDFVLYKNANWMMLPFGTIEKHSSFRIVFDNNVDPAYKVVLRGDESPCWRVMDGDNIAEYISLGTSSDLSAFSVNNLVYAKRLKDAFISPAKVFGNMETNPIIQEVMSSKVTEGSRYIRLTDMNGKNYGFMIFRNLFNLNKNDSLTISIMDIISEPNNFEAIFTTVRKKSPIPNILPQFTENVYAMFFNI